MTCRNEHGEVEVTNAVFRMARGRNTVVDNFHAGGIAAAVDVDTGQLGRATDMGVDAATGWCDVHPQTGGVISGRTLPLWRETIQLVEQAHAMFSDRVLIGWDVAILEDGPHLVEGNGAPGPRYRSKDASCAYRQRSCRTDSCLPLEAGCRRVKQFSSRSDCLFDIYTNLSGPFEAPPGSTGTRSGPRTSTRASLGIPRKNASPLSSE